MRKCARCGSSFEPGTADQRYDARCLAELAVLMAARPRPTFVPEWLRRDTAKELAR